MNRCRTFTRLMGMIRSLWGVMILSILMRAMGQGSGIAILTLGAWGIGLVVLGPDPGFLGMFVVSLAVAGMLKGIFRYLEHFTGHYVAFHLLAIMRKRLYLHLEPLAPAGLVNTHSGDLISRSMADVSRIEVFYAHTIAPAVNAILVPALALVALSWFDSLLIWTLLPFIVGVGVFAPWLSDRMGKTFSMGVRKAAGDVSAYLTDSIQGLREIVAFGNENLRRKEIWAGGERLVSAQSRVAYASGVQNAITDSMIAGGILSVLGVGLWLIDQGGLSILQLPPILALATTSFGPILGASNVIHEFNQAMAGAGRLFAIMDLSPVVRETTTTPPSDPVEPTIHFEDVYFRYPAVEQSANDQISSPTPWVHAGLSIDVPAGRTIALVGRSGAGKSTVVNLLLRFWDVDKGRVRIGKHDVRDFPLEELRRRIAVVSQHTYIFNTSIQENLLVGNPQASDANIERAARMANIHDFIVSLPGGYKTRVGEMGVKLSGGQRQRLAIARALLKDAPIMILDEATSNLDAENEREIQASIHQLVRGRTTLVIAHRLSTVVNADEILVMDGGRIVERGNHTELLARSGVYALMFARQQDELRGMSGGVWNRAHAFHFNG